MHSNRRFNRSLIVLGVMLLFGISAIQPRLHFARSVLRLERARHAHSADRDAEEQSPEKAELEMEERSNGEETEPGPDHPDGALRFRRLQMQDENGLIPLDGLEKARRHVELMKIAQRERSKAKKGVAIESAGIKPDSWAWLGPGNIGGRIRSIVIHPTNTNTMWVGSVSGGIWRTNNGGAGWFPVDDFMANLAVATMIIDPTNPSVMYAGTGEGAVNNVNPATGVQGAQGAGVYKSTDGGVRWIQLSNTNPPTVCGGAASFCPWFFVNRLAISPNGNTILAATGTNIMRSTDGGGTWTVGAVGTWLDIDFDPTDNQNAIAGSTGFAVFSTDGGQNWTAATFSPAVSGRIEVAYAPSNGSIVYATVNQNNGDIYRSTDGGQNYSRVNTGNSIFLGAGNQGWYDNIIWVNPNDPNFVVVGGIHLWRGTYSSMTQQVSLTQISDGSSNSAHADHHMIVAHPAFNNNTNRTVFFGCDGGIYRTDNVSTVSQTSGWVNLNNNLGITQFYGAAANANSGVIIGGTQDNGTLRFNGSQQTWSVMVGGDGGFCAADPNDPLYFYGEYINLQINRSTNAGASAARIDSGIGDANNSNTSNFIAPFILDPNNSNTMLAGGISLWRSTNVKAVTPAWGTIKAPTAGSVPISAIAVSANSSDVICVGHNDGDIYLTSTGASGSPTWTKIDTADLPNRFVTRLVIDQTRSPNWLYVTFGGFGANVSDRGNNIFRSTDSGATWTSIQGSGTTGLPNAPIRSLVFHPANPNLLYVGTEVGVFTSEDGGVTWEVPQSGPSNVSVDELFWAGDNLFAATYGRGIYRASGGTYVDCNYNGTQLGTSDKPYKTITAGVNGVGDYQPLWIRPCNYNETITITKRMELRSLGGPAVIGRP